MSIVRFYIEKKTKVQFCDNTFKELKDFRIKNIENIITNISVKAIFWVKIYLFNVKKKPHRLLRHLPQNDNISGLDTHEFSSFDNFKLNK